MGFCMAAPLDRDARDALVRSAQGGDVVAFEQLIEGLVDQVRRFARAFTHGEDDADDLAQEALLKVYRSLGSYRFESAFSTWLFAVTRNVFLDQRKSRQAHDRAREEPLGDARESDEAGPAPPDAHLAREEERRRIWAALRQIPEEYRTALVLYDLEGLSYDEVAAIEQVALGTIKSRLSRGREHLRRALLEDAAESGNRAARPLVERPERIPS
jgi:RNA polymerase sigma-70 factor (ECF subfamily)